MKNNNTEYSYVRIEQPFEQTKNHLYEIDARLDFINIERNKIIYLSHNGIGIEVPLSEIGGNSVYRLMYAKSLFNLNFNNIKFFKLEKNKMGGDS